MKKKQLQAFLFLFTRHLIVATFLVIISCSAIFANKSFVSISGLIKDESGVPVIKATVNIKGTNVGTVSDANGYFVLEAPANLAKITLVISSVGYRTLEFDATAQTSVTINLVKDESKLDDVVVVGYSTQSKRNISGSVSSVKGSDLTTVNSANLGQQLLGRAPGVEVSNDNTPGGQVAIRIHGIGSITGGNDPLFIVDGVPTQGGLTSLNPNDIENIQILKDASTASVYGSRASNGVVIITTKKGKAGNTVVTLETVFGVQQPRKDPLGYITAQQHGDILWQSLINAGQVSGTTGNPVHPFFGSGASAVPADYINPIGAMEGDPRVNPANYSNNPLAAGYGTSLFQLTKTAKEGTDWYGALTQTAPSINTNLTVSGGNEKGRFAISGSYYNQDGIMKFTNFTRYSFRANSELIVKNVVHIGENFTFSYVDDVNLGFPANGGVWQKFYHTPSFFPVKDIRGNNVGSRNGNMGIDGDPYVVLERNKDNHALTARGFGNLYIQLDLLKDFQLKTSLGVDYSSGKSSAFRPYPYEDPIAQPQQATLSVFNATNLGLTWTNTLTYDKSFGGDHVLKALIGTEAVKFNSSFFSAGRTGYAFEDIDYQYLSSGNTVDNASGSASAFSLFSLFAKADYAYKGKYLFSATVRRDASSRFSEKYRWGTFPAFSAAWRLSDEYFMRGVKWIDDLKVRASWGITGNQEIDSYNAYSSFETSRHSSSYDIGGTGNSLVSGFERSTIGNPEARWEEQTSTNVGIDATLFDRHFDFSIDFYKRNVDGLLLVLPVLATNGMNQTAAQNIGSMYNKGIDLSLTYNGGRGNGDWKYSIGVIWSTYKNEVTQLFGGPNSFIGGFGTYRTPSMTRTVVGRPIASFYGYQFLGLFQTQAEADAHATQGGNRAVFNQPGRMIFANLDNKDNANVINGADQTFIGSPIPDFTYGFNISVAYKNLDLTIFMQGVQGNEIFNFNKFYTHFMPNSYISPKMLDAWTPDNTDATVPRLRQGTSAFESLPSTYYVEDGSYFRGKNIMLGYTLPAKILQKAFIDRLRVYVSAQNFFTITNYSGFDPEVNYLSYGNGGARDIGVDRGIYPPAKSFFVGLQVGF